MEKNDVMQLSYDTDADILYLSIGNPRPAISREVGNDVILRLDPNTGDVIGLTILNLSTHDSFDNLPIHVAMTHTPSAS
ncbi:MAG: DUF2283 domain-containing protein [bacterium]|nr:DUF2283 domain-containing protein [bacterium]